MNNNQEIVKEAEFTEVEEAQAQETVEAPQEAETPVLKIRIHPNAEGVKPIDFTIQGLTNEHFSQVMATSVLSPTGVTLLGKYFIPCLSGIRVIERV